MTGPFNPSEEYPIPPWRSQDPLPSKETRVYVIGMEAIGGKLRFYFVETPPLPDPSVVGPLTIRVPTDCVIVLRLDSAWNWEFRHDNAVMLGPMLYPDKPRYFNLVPMIVGGRCQEVRFNALYLSGVEGVNFDPYAFYVNLDQDGAAPLLLRIDPDVNNPGNRP